jgi:hypothetical protein
LAVTSNATTVIKRTISVNNGGNATTTNNLFGVESFVTGAVLSAVGFKADVTDVTGENIGIDIANASTQTSSTQWGSQTKVRGIGPDTKYGHYTIIDTGGRDNYGSYNEVGDGTNTNTGYYANIFGTVGKGNYVLKGVNSSAIPTGSDTQYGAFLQVNGAGSTSSTSKYGGFFDVSGDGKGHIGVYIRVQSAVSSNYGVEAYATGIYGDNIGVYAVNDTVVTGGGDTQYGGFFDTYGSGDAASTTKFGVYASASNSALINYGVYTKAENANINYGLYSGRGRWTFLHDPNAELGVGDPEGYGDIVYFGGGGSSFNPGDVVYLDSNGDWLQTNATTATTATNMLGLALGAAPSDGILIRGYAYSSGWSWTIGVPLYLRSGAPGQMSNTAPTAAREIVRIVGYATGDVGSVNKIYFSPDNSWVEL